MTQIYQVKQEGELYLWKYIQDKNFPGYHMAWSNGGNRSFQEFITLLSFSNMGTYRTLDLSKPNSDILAVPNNKDNGIEFFSKLKVQIGEEKDWDLSFEGDKATMIMSVKSAKKLSEKISNVKSHVELSFEKISFWW